MTFLRTLPNYYNLQIMFNQQFDPGNLVRGLSHAVDFFQLEVSDYYDGLKDAAYTAAVAEHLTSPGASGNIPTILSTLRATAIRRFDCLRLLQLHPV